MSFIKLDRNIVDSFCFANPNHLKIWIWMLTKATYKKSYPKLKVSKGFITVELNRGQLLFGRLKASEELDISESIIRRTLDKFEQLGQIKIERTNLFSIITICKYDTYQSNTCETDQLTTNQEPTNDQALANQEPTNDQPTTIYKEGLEGEEGEECLEGEEILFIKSGNFVFSDFNDLPSNYIQSVIEQFKIQKQQTISSNEITSMWEVFKLQNLTGTKFYNNEHSVYQHFVNWIKNQNFKNGTNKQPPSISSVASANFEALRNWSDQFSDDHPNSNAK